MDQNKLIEQARKLAEKGKARVRRNRRKTLYPCILSAGMGLPGVRRRVLASKLQHQAID